MNRSISAYSQNNLSTTYYRVVRRSTFTGKEQDEETGYSYFGARYYDADLLTGWMSVDPLSDKYPSISPYAYCAWNPMKLVDPDGKKVKGVKYVNGEYQYSRWALKNGTDRYINVRSQTKTGRENLNRMLSDKKTYRLLVTDKPLFQKTNQGFIKLGGFHWNNDIIVSTNLNPHKLGQGAYIYEQNPDGSYYSGSHIILQKYNFTDKDMYSSDLSSEESLQAQGCYDDIPLSELSIEERINCMGAHEEAHLLNNANESTAIEAECNARNEWEER